MSLVLVVQLLAYLYDVNVVKTLTLLCRQNFIPTCNRCTVIIIADVSLERVTRDARVFLNHHAIVYIALDFTCIALLNLAEVQAINTSLRL